jgi:hypothetical protein
MGKHWVTLFFTGRDHAGENLAKVLDHREAERSPPLHMCDGLAQNVPKGHVTVGCQCNCPRPARICGTGGFVS